MSIPLKFSCSYSHTELNPFFSPPIAIEEGGSKARPYNDNRNLENRTEIPDASLESCSLVKKCQSTDQDLRMEDIHLDGLKVSNFILLITFESEKIRLDYISKILFMKVTDVVFISESEEMVSIDRSVSSARNDQQAAISLHLCPENDARPLSDQKDTTGNRCLIVKFSCPVKRYSNRLFLALVIYII